MFSFFKSKDKSVWDQIFTTSPQYKEFKPIIRDFFEPDKIDYKKFLANYKVLEHQSVKLFEQYIDFTDDEKFLKGHNTKGIDKLASIIDRPLGYYEWFIAAYPDVVNWATDLSDEEFVEYFGDPDKLEHMMNNEKRFKNEFLRIIVDMYLKIKKKKLETSEI